MIVYLDAGALVKRYVAEAGSADVAALIGQAAVLGTAILSRAEVAAALAWEHGQRGYAAAHLAAALYWQDMLGEQVALATDDLQLWDAARPAALPAWPEAL